MPRNFAALAASAAALCLAPFATAQTSQSPPAAAPAVAAAPYSPPRTSFGHPSFEGVWTSNFFLPLESTPMAPMLVLPEEGAKKMFQAVVAQMQNIPALKLDPETVPGIMESQGLAIVRGERRTRAVVLPADGKLPLTPEARREMSAGNSSFGGLNNPEERPNWERCVALFGQPPINGTGGANPRRFVQTPDHVVLQTEYGDEVRIIPYTDRHRPVMFAAALGDSIARWEGDTLVIETIGLPDKDRFRTFTTLVVPSTSKVIERYTRLSDKELLYQYTVEDPSAYTAPWLAEYSLYRTDTPMYEFSCNAGNYSLPNIMRAERVKEERAAKTKP